MSTDCGVDSDWLTSTLHGSHVSDNGLICANLQQQQIRCLRARDREAGSAGIRYDSADEDPRRLQLDVTV